MTTNPVPGMSGETPSPRSDAEAPAASTLDEGTFDAILEPRRSGLFVGDGRWHQLARAYRTVQILSLAGSFVLVVAAAVVVSLLTRMPWVWFAAGAVLIGIVVSLIITPRQIRAFGYRLREDDLVMRRGILFQRIVAVPYGRMQLVDITHGPLDRAFGIAQLKLVTAAATTAVVLPGLTQDGAEELRDLLIEVAETRRTGL
ncbi:PH domain-containing protein [Microbacterium sp. NPDC089189]|uniref:PH domain-containing protein n=1 Tax=Microbacterium sp. NPDC089189 TaxID=3154972 RepID=UPI0034447D78